LLITWASQEIVFANDSAKWLKNNVQGMLKTYDFPSIEVDGDVNADYMIKRATLFNDNVGFAFAHNSEAASPFVTWRMFNNDGKLEYEWGNCFSDEVNALVDYISRIENYNY